MWKKVVIYIVSMIGCLCALGIAFVLSLINPTLSMHAFEQYAKYLNHESKTKDIL